MARGAARALHCDGEAVTLGPCTDGQFLKRDGNKLIGAEAGGDSGAIEDHEAAADPHPGYLTSVEADAIYEATGAAASAVTTHEAAVDPHPAYLQQAEADALYDPAGEAVAEVAAHEALANPHPVYTTAAEAAAAAPVQSVAGKTGVVTLAKADVGLGNVDNTTDAAKPVSTATQTALNGKEAANANIQAHVASAHAPSNAQKNSDITKGEIEAKLTGEISSHTHAGGGSDPWTYLRLASDFTTTSSTAVDVTGFGFTPAANQRYEFVGRLMVRTATATVGPRPGMAWATGLSDGVAFIQQTSSATANVFANGNIAAAVLAPVGGVPTTTGSWPALIEGLVMVGATPSGNIRVQLASETNGTTVTMKAGSFLKYRTVP